MVTMLASSSTPIIAAYNLLNGFLWCFLDKAAGARGALDTPSAGAATMPGQLC